MVLGVVLVLQGKGLSETEEFRRNWPSREVAGECLMQGNQNVQSPLCTKELDVFLGVREIRAVRV